MQLSELLKLTRQYFWDLGYTEVETNYLQKELPLEPNLYAFQTDDYFLPLSPEFALKEFLARERKNCFSLAHCFRRLESAGPHHRPEFLMLEYYLVDQTLSDLQSSLIKYLSLFFKFCPAGNPLGGQISNFQLPSGLPATESDFNQFFLNEIEPSLPRDKAVFVTGYPAYLSPLAKAEGGAVGVDHCVRPTLQIAARFELYINGIEIANGCEENRNAEQIKSAFENEQQFRLKNNLPLHPYSPKFIDNCAALPPAAGVGIGLERLLMLINGEKSI